MTAGDVELMNAIEKKVNDKNWRVFFLVGVWCNQRILSNFHRYIFIFYFYKSFLYSIITLYLQTD